MRSSRRPPTARSTPAAEKRLKVLQSLDSLGAGFSLASHDLDIRGAGNLLGEEQSGHIKEVGYELYQTMLEEAVAKLRTGEETLEAEGAWSPQINIGTSVLIPETYVPDLQVRLGLYRRLADLARAEPTRRLRRRTARPLRPRCRRKCSTCSMSFRSSCCAARPMWPASMPDPRARSSAFAAMPWPIRRNWSQWITGQGELAKLRPDMKLVIMRYWEKPEDRLKGARQIMQTLVKLTG